MTQKTLQLKPSNPEIYSVRVDAFTATSSVASNRVRAKAFVRELAMMLEDMYFYHENYQRLTQNGAKGWRRGSLEYLEYWNRKKDYRMEWNSVSVKGIQSQDALQYALTFEEDWKCSRMDVAVDVAFASPHTGYLAEIYNKNRRWDDKLKYVSSVTGDTLYRNSRQSPTFGRIYDKSEAYGLRLGCVYRFEIEFKKINAARLKQAFKSAEDVNNLLLGVAEKTFKSWNIPIPVQAGQIVLPRMQAVLSSDEGKLEWLATISGAIRKLVEKGYESEVREMLNLPEKTDIDLTFPLPGLY